VHIGDYFLGEIFLKIIPISSRIYTAYKKIYGKEKIKNFSP
jgi:hypothetical protein